MDVVTKVRAQWDRTCAIGCTAAGAIVLIVGWFGISATGYPAEQLPYILSAGLGGLFLLGVAAVLWLSADLRDEWRKLDGIEQAIRESGFAEDGPVEVSAASSADTRTISSTNSHHAEDDYSAGATMGSLR